MKSLLYCLLIVMLLLVGCDNKIEYTKIDYETAYNNLQNNNNIIIIDVRNPIEYNAYHIENAVNIPVLGIKDTIEKEIPDKNKTIYVYCQSGTRSKSAFDILISLGYKNVYDMGGIDNWPYGTSK